jgi:hypothetical protein
MHSAIVLLTTTALLSATLPAAAEGPAPTAAAPTPAVRPVLAYAAPDSAPPVQPTPEPTPTTGKVPDDARGSDAMPRAIGWFTLGLGISSAVVAAGTSIMMLQQASIRNGDCDGKLCSAAGVNANNQLQGLAGWNAASYIVAAAGIGIGAFLLITNPANGEKQTAIGVSPTNSGAGLVLRSTF